MIVLAVMVNCVIGVAMCLVCSWPREEPCLVSKRGISLSEV